MLRWLQKQQNIELILGNHEAMLLSCEFVFDEITNESVEAMTSEKLELLNHYMTNGGALTLAYLRMLSKESPEELREIFSYLHNAPLYGAVTAGGNDFFLVHSGIDHFDKSKKVSQYASDDFLWCRPAIDDDYFDDIITVFGHTPTMYYGNEYRGKIIKTKTWINIDVGAAYGQKPLLLRLDDLKEFYAD